MNRFPLLHTDEGFTDYDKFEKDERAYYDHADEQEKSSKEDQDESE